MGDGKRGKGDKRLKKFVGYVAVISWFVSMAFMGFYFPSFVDNSPIFKVSRVDIEGNNLIPESEIRPIVERLGNNWLLLSKEHILNILRRHTGNAIEDILIEKSFSTNGVSLKVKLKERKPVAVISIEGHLSLLDKNGELFPVKYVDVESYPVIYTTHLNKQFFPNFYTYVMRELDNLELREVYISEDKVTLYMGKGNKLKVILPPIEFINSTVSERLKILYNLNEGIVDLRYSKFILLN